MTSRPGRDRLFAALALVWLLAAGGAAAADWPTPAKAAGDRLRLAFLAANMLDKEIRPYDIPLRENLDAQYQEFTADFRSRYGARFDTALIDRRHGEAMAGMAAERLRIIGFAVASTALVWRLLWTIRSLLGREAVGNR